MSKEIFWEEHIKRWNKRGVSQAKYCKENNLNKNLFSKWKNKIIPKDIVKANEFVELKVSEMSKESEIEVIVKDIFKLRLKSGFDKELVKEVIEVIIGGIQ